MNKADNIIKIFEALKIDFLPRPTAVLPKTQVRRAPSASRGSQASPKLSKTVSLCRNPSEDLLETSGLEGRAQFFPV